jgi:hypothetical protein
MKRAPLIIFALGMALNVYVCNPDRDNTLRYNAGKYCPCKTSISCNLLLAVS